MDRMTMTLYQLGVEGLELERILTESGGELSLETEDHLDTFLRSGKEKINAACMVVRAMKLSEDAIEEEIRRLDIRLASFESDRDRLEARILGAVDAAFDGKVKTDLFTVWGQTGADTFTVDIAADCDLQQLHQADPYLVRVGYSLDKANCREVIKEGTAIDGVTVTENPGKRYLRIK
jgi:hypothetical protein